MKTRQNVLKMSTVSPDTSRETATPLTDGCNNNRMVQLSIWPTVSVSIVQDAIKIKRLSLSGNGITYDLRICSAVSTE